ncbi:MAG: methyltransferase domain-containing protein [Bacteroidota bacterium]
MRSIPVISIMWIDTRQRSQETEIMDDFALAGETLRHSLDEIARINHWLGGNRITLNGVSRLVSSIQPHKPVRIWDLGCGNGDMLRMLARWGRTQGIKLDLLGIDANADTITYAEELSANYPEIRYLCTILPDPELENQSTDIVLCTLFLHHFSDEDIATLLKCFAPRTEVGIVVNDLQRSKLAYFLFSLLTWFHSNKMVREDGLLSILRGFQRTELQSLAKRLPNWRSGIKWRWAFRYQWILQPPAEGS